MASTRTRGVAAAFGMAILTCAAGEVHAQGTWDAILTIDPYPSPYYSDWDANPNISSLTVINSTSSPARVRIHFNVIDRTNRIVVSGSSEPEVIEAGATVIFDSPYDVAGSTTHDTELEETAARTGRLPEGDYTACAVAADEAGFVLTESCSTFTIVYPDPPLLLGPLDGEVVDQPDPLLLWTPVQVPIDYQISYIVRVAEVLEGQTPAEALRSNIPHYQSLDAQLPSLRYPIDARPFEHGKTYAWTVQALDQNGYSAAANDGRSEIWSFRYGDSTTPLVPADIAIPVSVSNHIDRPGAAPPSIGFPEICDKWETNGPIERIVYPVANHFSFPSELSVAGRLVRDTLPDTDGRRRWVVYGSNDTHMVMFAGDCGVFNQNTALRWVGIRTAGDANELRDWVATDVSTTATDAVGAKLKFGVAIISAFEETLGEEESSLAPVRTFLEGHEVDVKPGFNLIGVLDARQLSMWPLFEALGHDATTSEIELQGYIGLNTTAAVEMRGGSDEISGGFGMTHEYLTVSAMLPERQLRSGPIRTIRTGLELSFGDSMGVGGKRDRTVGDTAFSADTDFSLHPLVKVLVEMETQRGITWEGALEIDLGYDFEEWDTKPTLRLTTDHAWQPWDAVDLKLGNPEAALAINDGLFKAIAERDQRQLDLDLTLRGSLILYGEDIARGAITFGRHAVNKESMERTKAYLEASKTLASMAWDDRNRALARGDSAAAAEFDRKHTDLLRDIAEDEIRLRADSSAIAAARGGGKAPAAAKSDGGLYWKASFTLGNMSLLNLIDLAGNVTRAITAAREDE